MNESHASAADLHATSTDVPEQRALPPVEFVGSSDHTIAEAVRRALSRASLSLRTLDGAGVVVIPQIQRRSNGPRFRVTLRVSPNAPTPQG